MNNWRDSLTEYFRQGMKKDCRSRLGVEVEHFIVDPFRQAAVPYSGDRGVRQILTRLMERYPGAMVLQDDDFFGFSVPEFTVTLEPAAQIEISIAPSESVRRIGEIYSNFYDQLDSVLAGFGYTAVNAGCQPYTRVADLEMIPKKRYDLMNAWFRTSGTGGMEMMRGTASLQVSIDYASEEDFRNKIRAAYFYSPVLKMLCDNSIAFQGQSLEMNLKRTDIWRRTDPARCGLQPEVFSGSCTFADYADFIGRMPPIFLKRDGQVLPTGSRTVAELYQGRQLQEDEIIHVLSMAFPDVRLKQFLELRFADSVPLPFVKAYAALVKGLLYSEAGIASAAERIRDLRISEDTIRQAEDSLMAEGWGAKVYGRPASDLAEDCLQLAERQLPDEEKIFLEPFYMVIRYGGIPGIPANKLARLWD